MIHRWIMALSLNVTTIDQVSLVDEQQIDRRV